MNTLPIATDPINWKRLAQPTPYTVAQMLVTDGQRVLVIHRSNNVRSAKNVWSLPSGLHDIGEKLTECAVRELHEEFGLTAVGIPDYVGFYENIVLDEADAFHWVIQMFVIRVDNFDDLVNKEPDKHDQFDLVPVTDIERLCETHKFHRSFDEFFTSHKAPILDLFSCM